MSGLSAIQSQPGLASLKREAQKESVARRLPLCRECSRETVVMVNEFIYRLNNKGSSPSGTRATPQNALGMPLCSHALKHVCNQSNGMAEHQGRGDIETRELKSESGTCNVSFCVFSKCYV